MTIPSIVLFDFAGPAAWLRIAIALVWLVFGLVFKALDLLPRHGRIVARVVGERAARTVTLLVAAGEVGMGLWMIYGRWLAVCVGLQTVVLMAMNTLEIRRARDLLVTPIGMVCANLGLLAAGWYVALHTG